ncbi:hypothetical protein AXG93_4295s1440 [Marchantia polymorpha subsp. ruderalis]|uniref:Uncharacterized protein n=1 Tax=Marchantia polymorpha subsp. ruderalis TaxID=1480154 RepID=A0A176WAV8_MARPO|nr:hypothetical protein AXG93_4295s1440 [Marchantia polymorpha subsp. ruderalis]
MNKSTTEGEELRGNPMLWTIEHWTKPARTTYVTAWQVGFFERILKGQRVHWARIFYDLVWMNAGSWWTGPLTNHITPFLVNFYRGMGLLTREEEKRFPREREILTAESSEETEDENRPSSIPTHTTARGPVQVDVVQRREKPERRLAKRRKVVSDDEEELTHETRSARGEETLQLKMNEDLEKESTLSEEIVEQVVARIGGTVVEADGITLPTSPGEWVRSEEEKKASSEDAKVLEVTFADFLQDSVVPLLKYLDGKRERYVVSKEPGFYVVD